MDSATIISHLDADGITSASIMASALGKADIEYDMVFTRQIDEEVLGRDYSGDIIVYTDLGSGYINDILRAYPDRRMLIVDHHHPLIAQDRIGDVVQLNPHLIGMDGAIDISGSGMAFLAAMSISEENSRLAPLAIVGAVGDMQDSQHRKLVGLNRDII
ncbi:MAG TPA: DHH family phosphoesterase, partial [Methanothrix sp.]|nr:DHH family phosphoesterase [Methanothrix sp.]